MDTLRKILTNLQKYGAFTITPIKKRSSEDVNVITPLLPANHSLEEAEAVEKYPILELGVNADTSHTKDTKECLKEFDDILEDINKDVTKNASLDEIDDVLKDMEQEGTKEIMFDIPRFDLAQISGAFENIKDDNDVDLSNSLITLDDSIVSLSDDYFDNIYADLIEQSDIISISSEDSVKNILTENTTNIQQTMDVTSINTEENKDNRKHIESIKCETLESNYIEAEKDQGIEKHTTSDVVNSDETRINEPRHKTNEGISHNAIESNKEINDLTTKEVVFMDESDDCGYQSSDFEFITEEEAKLDGLIINFKKNTLKRKVTRSNRVKTIEITVDQFTIEKKIPKRKKIKRKSRNIVEDPDWSPESDTDTISDDEFIPDDMKYQNMINTRSKNNIAPEKSPECNNSITSSLRQIRIFPRTNNASSGFKNIQINSGSFTTRKTTTHNIHLIQNNEDNDKPAQNNILEFTNECGNKPEAKTQMEYKDEGNLMQINPGLNCNPDQLEKTPDFDKHIPGSSFMPDNHPDSHIIVHTMVKTNKIPDGPELKNITGPTPNSSAKNNVDPGPSELQSPESTITPGTSTKNAPDSNDYNPDGPIEMHEMSEINNFGSNYKRNRSHLDDIEKWRMYQIRTLKNRQQFVVDYSYRAQHRIYHGSDHHQLFDPNRAPLPNVRSVRLLENKSTVCKNSMLVEYAGVGFDMPMWDSGSEDDEVKQEANECANKILEMYPGQNTRRRRRF